MPRPINSNDPRAIQKVQTRTRKDRGGKTREILLSLRTSFKKRRSREKKMKKTKSSPLKEPFKIKASPKKVIHYTREEHMEGLVEAYDSGYADGRQETAKEIFKEIEKIRSKLYTDDDVDDTTYEIVLQAFEDLESRFGKGATLPKEVLKE